jgi:hypothetical protein
MTTPTKAKGRQTLTRRSPHWAISRHYEINEAKL